MKKSPESLPEYNLKLYITGASPNSTKAVANIKHICEQHLKGRYNLEIIDVYQASSIAQAEQIVALPLLVKLSPYPKKRLIGNMSDTGKVLKGLELI